MERIVVGVDDSEGSRRALEWAVAEARIRGAGRSRARLAPPVRSDGPVRSRTRAEPEMVEADACDVLTKSIEAVDAGGLPEPSTRSRL